jgi:hypothetical protein
MHDPRAKSCTLSRDTIDLLFMHVAQYLEKAELGSALVSLAERHFIEIFKR